MKKLLALILTVCLMLTLAFATVHAADADPDPPNIIAPTELEK